jgi:pimeloyl-ACP methyl ester carboxylesterase
MTVPLEMRTVTAEGETFEIFDVGAGRPVLLLHGAAGDWRTLAPHCRILSVDRRAMTYTQRHFGTRAWKADSHPFGIETHARDLIAIAEALELGPIHLVAWSYAGHAALRAAQLRPDLFNAILIYESGFQTFMTDPQEIDAFKTSIESMFGPVFEAYRTGDHVGALKALVDGSANIRGYFDAQAEESRKIQLDNTHTMALLLSQTPPPRITAEDLGKLQVPVTIVTGEQSLAAYQLVAAAAMRAIGGDHHRKLPGKNHFWPDEDPEGFAHFIAEWMDRN